MEDTEYKGTDVSFPGPESSIAPDIGKSVKSPKTKKKRSLLEDDFFSLSSTIDKKKGKKHRHKKHKLPSVDSTAPDTAISQALDHSPEINDNSFNELTPASALTSVSTEPDVDVNVPIQSSYNSLVGDEDIAIVSIEKLSVAAPNTNKSAKSTTSLSPKRTTTGTRNVWNSPASRTRSSIANENEVALEEEDEEDEEDDELHFFGSKPTHTISKPDGKYSFGDGNEKKRKYIIRVYSRLTLPDGETDCWADFGTKGTKGFDKILASVLDHFRTKFRSNLPPEDLALYSASNAALVWIEGRMEMKSFFKPSTLRIPPPPLYDILENDVEKMEPTKLNCLLIPKRNALFFQSLYPEFQSEKEVESNRTVPEPEDLIAEVEPWVDTIEDEDDYEVTQIIEDETEAYKKGEDLFFVIGLKGKDNKRINVQVSQDTLLRKLLLHYLKEKKIDEKTVDMKKAKLIFDDEPMDLDGRVGDTELEEDFEVQVVI